MKRKPTTKDRLAESRQRAADTDARRQEQISHQIKAIERLMVINSLLAQFIRERDIEADWDVFREEKVAQQRQAAEAREDGSTATPTKEDS